MKLSLAARLAPLLVSKKFIRRAAVATLVIFGFAFVAIQAIADPTARGENSTIDRTLQVNPGSVENQYAVHPDTNFTNGQTYGTWEAWIYPTNKSSRQPIFAKEDNYIFGLDSGRLWSAVTNGSSWIESVSQVEVPMNTWSHVAFIKIGGRGIVFYLNGEEVVYYPNGVYDTLRINSEPFTVGRRNQWERFNGRIDEVKIWNTDRRNQIASNMHVKVPGNSSGLQGYWDFNEPSGNIAYDRTTGGYVRDLTLMNSPSRGDVKSVSTTSTGSTAVTFPGLICQVHQPGLFPP